MHYKNLTIKDWLIFGNSIANYTHFLNVDFFLQHTNAVIFKEETINDFNFKTKLFLI